MSAATGSETRTRIQSIQYLRALAVLAVVLDHASLQASMDKYFGAAAEYRFLLVGFSGVDLFFGISGFIITVVTLDAQWRPRVPLALFAWNRFVRIVPTLWVAVLSLALMRHVGSGLREGEPDYWTALTLWPWGPVNPDHIWSVRQELAFYAVFALAAFTRLPGARAIFLLWWLVQLVSGLMPPDALGVWADTLVRPVNVHFGWGVVLGGLYLRGWFQGHGWGATRWLTWGQTAAFGVALAVVWAAHLEDPTVLTHKLAIGAMFTALVYASLALQETQPGGWGRVLGFLGEASYSIYLFHVHGQTLMLKVVHGLAPGTPAPLAVGLVALGSLALACGAYLWIEKPLITQLRPLFRPLHGRGGVGG